MRKLKIDKESLYLLGLALIYFVWGCANIFAAYMTVFLGIKPYSDHTLSNLWSLTILVASLLTGIISLFFSTPISSESKYLSNRKINGALNFTTWVLLMFAPIVLGHPFQYSLYLIMLGLGHILGYFYSNLLSLKRSKSQFRLGLTFIIISPVVIIISLLLNNPILLWFFTNIMAGFISIVWCLEIIYHIK